MKYSALVLSLVLLLSCCQKHEEISGSTLSSLDQLKAGNDRFVSGHPVHPHETLQRLRDLKRGQTPIAVVVSCSDSRIPPELIFDQGLGDIFSIRTAGNVIGDYELGSIEYAVEHLQCKLVVVMGHESCGAVTAYAKAGNESHGDDHIQNIISYLAAEEEEKNIPDSLRSDIDLLVKANISHGVSLLKTSAPVLKPLVDKNEIMVVGAYYDLDTGKVLFE